MANNGLPQASVPVVAPSLQCYEEFKDQIINRLRWTKMDWSNSLSVGSDIYYFCRNIWYWFRQLVEASDPRYLVVTFFSSGSDPKPTLIQCVNAYKKQFGLAGLSGASRSINKNYFVLLFNSVEERQHALQNFLFVNQSFVVNSEWIREKQDIQFELNGFPPDISLDDVRGELEKFASVNTVRKVVLDLGDGDSLPSGMVKGSLNSSVLSVLDDLPHFISVNRFSAHWIIYCRKTICFTCGCVGHLASGCPTPRCVNCHQLLAKSHLCPSTEGSLKQLQTVISNNPLSSSYFVASPDSFSSPGKSLLSLHSDPILNSPFVGVAANHLHPHESWNNSSDIVLPAGFADHLDNKNITHELSDSTVDNTLSWQFDRKLFYRSMNSLKSLQDAAGDTISSLKTFPLETSSVELLGGISSGGVKPKLHLVKAELGGSGDPPDKLAKVKVKKKQASKH